MVKRDGSVERTRAKNLGKSGNEKIQKVKLEKRKKKTYTGKGKSGEVIFDEKRDDRIGKALSTVAEDEQWRDREKNFV